MYGDPETTTSTLRSYNLVSKEVGEIARTGGWESSTDFSHVYGWTAIGMWGAEGFFGYTELDLETGQEVWDSEAAGLECFDGEGCQAFDTSTLFDDEIYGVGPVFDPEVGLVRTMGIFRFDRTALSADLLIEFPWDNGLWYPEDMFAFGDVLVISLGDRPDNSIEDEPNNPLPAVVFDPETSEAWTVPEIGFVRPGYLS